MAEEGSLLDRAGKTFPAEVAKTLTALPPHDLDHAMPLLADPKRRLTLGGGRFTHLLAHYLGLHLMQLREDVRFLPDRDVERTATLTSLGRRDVLVLFDYRRYEQDKVVMAGLVRERGGRVLLFTDTWLSPVTSRADVVLPCRVTAPSPCDSLVPTLAVIETVVAGVVETLGEAAHEHLRKTEDVAQHLGLA
ncbi:MurR/RpiR family transcriptional regulator [Streptomyces bungoensis]|uniref:MurR/RpiR family transcriptional regulator n=1 Tax=Streptomyces bungoensis TaxID=285568 RepID=UPI0036CDB37B